jgi:multicomponent Na+:H+ antiporter subunit D
MPWTAAFCIVGAASISAFPLFSGFVTKSMVMAAAMEQDRFWTWLVLLFASAGVFHHAGIKIPYFAFFAHDSGKRCREAPLNMLVAMAIAAALCIAIGSMPGAFYAFLPFEAEYHPYSVEHVTEQLQLLFWSALAFAMLMRTGIYPPELASTNLDFDWIYRHAGRSVAEAAGRVAAKSWARLAGATVAAGRHVLASLRALCSADGLPSQLNQTSIMVFWTTLLLAAYLLLSYF